MGDRQLQCRRERAHKPLALALVSAIMAPAMINGYWREHSEPHYMARQKEDHDKSERGICPKCDEPYQRTESPDRSAIARLIRVEQRCLTCGGRITSWRRRA